MNELLKELLTKTKYFIGTGGLDGDVSFCNICKADAYELKRRNADEYGNFEHYWKIDHKPSCLLIIIRQDLNIDSDDTN